MKKQTKFFALAMAIVLCAGLLAGCANTGKPAAQAWANADDLKNKKIAVQEGTTGNDVATAIEGTKVSAFKAATACAMELMNGRVDAVIIDSNPAQKLVEANAEKLMLLPFNASEDKETYAMATQKNDAGKALAAELSAAMKTLKDDGTFDAIMQKNIAGAEGDLPAPAQVAVKGKLTMGTNAEFEPFEYLNSKGEVVGFDVDYAKYLCAAMGYELKVENMDFDALIPALQSGRLDFVAAGMTITEERQGNVNFTDGYYEAIQAIIVNK